MTNKEKAQSIALSLQNSMLDGRIIVDVIEAELNRLESPEPEKWEPREGRYSIRGNGRIWVHYIPHCNEQGRSYPTADEAGRAAPLHRKLDRLVNLLVEHCPEDWKSEIRLRFLYDGTLVVDFLGTDQFGFKIVNMVESGEVEL